MAFKIQESALASMVVAVALFGATVYVTTSAFEIQHHAASGTKTAPVVRTVGSLAMPRSVPAVPQSLFMRSEAKSSTSFSETATFGATLTLAASGLVLLVGATLRFLKSRPQEGTQYSVLLASGTRSDRERRQKEEAQREIQERLARLARLGVLPSDHPAAAAINGAAPSSSRPAPAAYTPPPPPAAGGSDWESRQRARERMEREKEAAKQREIQERLARLAAMGALSTPPPPPPPTRAAPPAAASYSAAPRSPVSYSPPPAPAPAPAPAATSSFGTANEWERRQQERERREREAEEKKQREIQERLARLAAIGAAPVARAVPAAPAPAPAARPASPVRSPAPSYTSPPPAPAPSYGSAVSTVTDWERRQQERERQEREREAAKQREIQERLARLAALGGGAPAATSAPVSNTRRQPPANLTLHVYDHCPYCIRVELFLGWNGVKYNRVVYGYGDMEGPKALIGKKQLPILTGDGAPYPAGLKGMPESLDMINWMVKDFGLVIPPASGRKDYAEWQKKAKNTIAGLMRPRLLKMPFRDFQTKQDVDYATAKWAKKGYNVEQAWASTPQLLQQMEALLWELEPMLRGQSSLNPEGFGMDDIFLLPDLRRLTVVRDLKWPAKVRQYVDKALNYPAMQCVPYDRWAF